MKCMSEIPVNTNYVADRAIIIYNDEQASNHAVALHYRIKDGEFRKPVPVSEKDLKAILEMVRTKTTSVEYLPEKILSYSSEKITWWVPAQQIWFRYRDTTTRIPCPSLVFQKEAGRSIKVWAVKNKQRPGPDTDLYCAPFPQVTGETGGVHLCGVNVPEGMTVANTDKWTDCVLDSEWTSLEMANVRHKDGFPGLLKELGGKKRFPVRQLLSCGKKLREVL
jgi:PRTRC genetic system protein B